jgi:hypothetical protein
MRNAQRVEPVGANVRRITWVHGQAGQRTLVGHALTDRCSGRSLFLRLTGKLSLDTLGEPVVLAGDAQQCMLHI